MSNPESPIGRFYPTGAELRDYRDSRGISLQDAKRALIRQNLHKACENAATFDDLRMIVRALISCAGI